MIIHQNRLDSILDSILFIPKVKSNGNPAIKQSDKCI